MPKSSTNPEYQGAGVLFDIILLVVGVLTRHEARERVEAITKNPDARSFVDSVIALLTFARGDSLSEPLWPTNRAKLGRVIASVAIRAAVGWETVEKSVERVKAMSPDPWLATFFIEVVTFLAWSQKATVPQPPGNTQTPLPQALIDARKKWEAGQPPIPMDHIGTVEWQYYYEGDGGSD